MQILPRSASFLRATSLLMLVLILWSCRDREQAAVSHRTFIVATNGTPQGDGSARAPWDLATALAHPQSLGPDDVILMLGGTYKGNFLSSLAGGEGHPVTIRQKDGEHAAIDGSLEIRGQYGIYWGFEVFNSDPNRTAASPGAEPADYKRPTAVVVHGPGTKLVNLVIHDGGAGVGFWATAINAEMYGCLIYNNGWQGPDAGHGVGIASQNDVGKKKIYDNVIFQQFDNGLSIYGSDKAHLTGFDIEGNVSFLNGTVNTQKSSWDIFIGGGVPSKDVRVSENYTFRRDGMLTARIGYEDGIENEDLELTKNYFVGQTELVNWKKLTLTGNVFTGAQNLLSTRMPTGVAPKSYSWNDNEVIIDTTIRTQGTDKPFQLIQDTTHRAFDLAAWKQETGLDGSSKASIGRPTGTRVFLRRSQMDSERSHVVVYNWSRLAAVDVDASSALETGDEYEIRSVSDIYGAPVVKGVFQGHKFGMKFLSGGSISIPMQALAPVQPIGSSPTAATPSQPEFGVFVLLRTSRHAK